MNHYRNSYVMVVDVVEEESVVYTWNMEVVLDVDRCCKITCNNQVVIFIMNASVFRLQCALNQRTRLIQNENRRSFGLVQHGLPPCPGFVTTISLSAALKREPKVLRLSSTCRKLDSTSTESTIMQLL